MDQLIGWISTDQIFWTLSIIIGGLAGWHAEHHMSSQLGVPIASLLGILGGFLAGSIIYLIGAKFYGIDYLIAGVIGAYILLLVGRVIRRA